ncbi:phosphatase [Coprinopsis cinerea okayama7|uniref:Phosphatase n=1 Tax=Coprinopsis cinerea (strain Okayama-7 / 130 / ATCC MYA-4618 / FGSC 9003) TaxID=240176 RepID=A8NWX7_COPC7|nr:phosphatase [Coprinopsis cinerea okayama7\|eukprot:XP_001837011.1 phosphatase [Coprinopsis cinerea okayama7\
MSEIVLTFDALLFDMDGTLVDSTAGVEGAWKVFKKSYPHIDVHDILSSAHGIRTVDNLKNYCGVTDPVQLENEAVRFEQAILSSASEDGGKGIVRLPGVEQIMKEIAPRRFHPNPLWAICTSATKPYASSALAVAGVPVPDVFVAAEDVEKGKPNPDPYLIGAARCNVDPKRCLVFEDAPSGIRSGRAAGCKTLALLTSHSREQVEAAQPDYIVKDLESVSIRVLEKGVEVTIRQ